MIQFKKVLVADDVIDEAFVCDLHACKGACCVEGDLGAPLDVEELTGLDEVLPHVKPYLSGESIAVLEKEGGYEADEEGDFVTTTVNGRECSFAFYDNQGMLKCSIEQANSDGKTNVLKPLSCHLYPIRVGKSAQYETLNYDRWEICSAACELGASLKVPVYKFLQQALIRKYGEHWFAEFEKLVADYKKQTDG